MQNTLFSLTFFNFFFARLARACRHIGGLLFALNGKHCIQCARNNTDDISTSQLCQWIIPRNHKQTSKPVKELSFVRPDLDSECRKEKLQSISIPGILKTYLMTSTTFDQVKELNKLFPNIGMYMIYVSFCLDFIQKTGS